MERKDEWTASQDQTIIEMRQNGLAWKEIADRVGRTVDGCCQRYRKLLPKGSRFVRNLTRWSDAELSILDDLLSNGKTAKYIEAAMNKPIKVVHARIQYGRRIHARKLHTHLVSRVYVPPARLEDRDRRMAAEMDLTSEFFGDPRPGQSALDKKQGAFA